MRPLLGSLLGLTLACTAQAAVVVREPPAPAQLLPREPPATVVYALRLGAYAGSGPAQDLIRQLRVLGVHPWVLLTRCPGAPPLHQVLLGEYGDRTSAERSPYWQLLAGFSIDLVTAPNPAAGAGAPVELAAEHCRTALVPRHPDEQRPAQRYTTRLFGRPLTLGGKVTLSSGYRQDLRLEREAEDAVGDLGLELQPELLYELGEALTLFLELSYEYEADVYAEDDEREAEDRWARGETWLYWHGLGRTELGLQLGRINLQEPREWWWDQDLDAVRLSRRSGALEFSAALAQELAAENSREDGVDPEQREVLRLPVQLGWHYAEHHSLEGFALAQHDHSPTPASGARVAADAEDDSDADLLWLGLRASGRWSPGARNRLYYWLDAAALGGRETRLTFDDSVAADLLVTRRRSIEVSGWAWDAAVIWQLPWVGRPWLTLGYARGSGDADRSDDRDTRFRQTGLHDNSQKLRGETRFQYYGELLRPDLSNLALATLGLGWRPAEGVSVDLVLHRYDQVEADAEVAGSRLRADPDGRSRDLGRELDLVLGVNRWPNLELDLVAAVFETGAAYAERSLERAYLLAVEAEWSF